MKKKSLRLYVWEDVLRDYSAGIMFALAESPEHARELILKKCDYVPTWEFAEAPREVSDPEGFVLYGGG